MKARSRRRVTAAALVLAILLAAYGAFHDRLYLRLVRPALEESLGVTLTVDGRFDLVHASPLELDVTGLHVEAAGADPDRLRGAIGDLRLAMPLWPLLRGDLRIASLRASDAHFDLVLSGDAGPGTSPGLALPPVEQMDLEQITVAWRRGAAGERTELLLARATASAGEGGALEVKAEGRLQGDAWSLQGDLGSLDALVSEAAPYPLAVSFRVPEWDLAVDAKGTVGEPLSGAGLDIALDASTKSLAPMLERLAPGTPLSGALTASARLAGDVTRARLSDIDATLDDGERIAARVKGTAPVQAWPRGLDVEAHVDTSDAAVARFLTRGALPGVTAMRLDLRVRAEGGGYRLQGVSGELSGGDGSKATLAGDVSLAEVDGAWQPGEVAMQISVDAPAEDLAAWLPGDLPPLDRVRASGHVSGDRAGVDLKGAEVSLSRASEASARVTGDLRLVRSGETWHPAGMNVDLNVDAPVADLRPWLPQGLSAEGRTKLVAKVTGTLEQLTAESFSLDLAGTAPLSGNIRGSAELALSGLPGPPAAAAIPAASTSAPAAPTPAPAAGSPSPPPSPGLDTRLVRLDSTVDLAAQDLRRAGEFLGIDLPALGATSFAAKVQRDAERWRLGDMKGRSRTAADLAATLEGSLVVEAASGSSASLGDVDVAFSARGPDAKAAAPLGVKLAVDPGPWSLKTRLKGPAGKVKVEQLHLEAGSGDGVHVEVEGTGGAVDSWVTGDLAGLRDVRLQGRAHLPRVEALGTLLGRTVPALGELDATFEAHAGSGGEWTLPRFKASVQGKPALGLTVEGSASGLPGHPSFAADLQLESADPSAVARALQTTASFGFPLSARGRVEGNAQQVSYAGRIEVGSTDLDTRLALALARERPLLAGKLETKLLNFADLGVTGGAATLGLDPRAPTTGKGPGRKSFDAEPFDLGLLGLADLDLQVFAHAATGTGLELGDLDMRVVNDARRLRFELADGELAGGRVWANVTYDSTESPPLMHLQSRSKALSLEALHGWFTRTEEPMTGRFSHDMNLTARGNSTEELVSTLSGRATHAIVDAKLVGGDLDLLDLRVMQLMLTMLAPRKRTTVNCIIADFTLTDGVAKSDTLFLETPKMLVAGTGTLDINSETVDFVLTARSRSRFQIFDRENTITVRGPLRALEVDANINLLSGEAAVTAGLAVSPVLAPMAGLSFITDILGGRGSSACEKAAQDAADGVEAPKSEQ